MIKPWPNTRTCTCATNHLENSVCMVCLQCENGRNKTFVDFAFCPWSHCDKPWKLLSNKIHLHNDVSPVPPQSNSLGLGRNYWYLLLYNQTEFHIIKHVQLYSYKYFWCFFIGGGGQSPSFYVARKLNLLCHALDCFRQIEKNHC